MKKTLLFSCLFAFSLGVQAQDNHGYGVDDCQFKSLAEEVAHLKKSNDMFNVYYWCPIKLFLRSYLFNSE